MFQPQICSVNSGVEEALVFLERNELGSPQECEL